MTDQSTTAPPGLIAWIAANRPLSGIVLMAAGVAVAAIPVVLHARYGTEFLSIEVVTGLMALMLLAAGVWQRFRPADAGSPVDEARMLVLALGGLGGLLIAAAGVVLAIQWWDFLTKWLRFGDRDGAWRVLVAIAVLLGGLGVMFVSLQSARTEVRHSPGLRRLLYGYNTVLACVLLFLILAVANVLAYTKLPNLVDSTETGVYKISDRSIQLLRSLDKPTHIYLLMRTGSSSYEDMNTLLSNIQEYSPQLRVETLSPDLNSSRIRELIKDYPQVESEGVLVVYGEDKGKLATFIKSEDIFKSDMSPDGQRTLSFEGESRLMTELSYLSENKQKPVVYFTQKNAGEMDLSDPSPTKDTAVGVLQQRLTKRNFDVRPLTFDPAEPKVPDDATVVVVAGPQRGFTEPAVNALRKYMDERKGKLVVLADVPRGDTWTTTGLEGLLASYNVQIANERVLTYPVRIGGNVLQNSDATLAVVPESLVNARQPIAVAFKEPFFYFLNTRVVRPTPPRGPGPQAETLLNTPEGLPVWVESDLKAKASTTIELFNKNRQEMQARLSREPLSLAVVVSEPTGPPSMGGPPSASKPRLAVFGNASFVSNPRIDEQRGVEENFDLFVSTLDWLRERPAGIGVEPRVFKNYMLDRSVNSARLLFLPALLGVVGIIGLGAGVWVMRRR